MKSAILFLVLVAAPTTLASPVEQVVNLLSNLKNQVEADGKRESQIYNKYACWCETTSARKASFIVQADEDLRSLGQQILKLKGKVAVLTAEIDELNSKIKAAVDDQETATAIREKENGAFSAETAELKEALAALQSAIGVLVKATTLAQTKSGALLQTGVEQQMRVSAIKNVINKLPSRGVHFDQKALSLLSNFAESKAHYAPQSATIQGMLGDMYSTMTTNLQESTETEATANRKYEDYFASLQEEINEMTATVAKKTGEKADAEAELASTTETYDDTEAERKAAIEFFDETKEACEAKNKEWETRVDMRDAELAGIEKALEILTSDKARALFAKSIKPGVEAASFLQVQSSPNAGSLLQNSAKEATNKAYLALKKAIKGSKNFRLAALAVSVRTAKFGHFEKVIKAIDDMLATLAKEGQDDVDKKDECLTKYQEIATTVADLDWKIKNNLATIAKLESKIEAAEEEKAQTIDEIKATEEQMKKMTKEREDENAAFLEAKKEDEGAIDLLEAATKALAKFYKEEGIKMGEIQGSATGFNQEEPAFEVSEDQAPDATFSKKGSRKLQSKNILSILAYITEDLYDEIEAGKKDEEKSQLEYEADMKAAETLVKDLTAKKIKLEDSIADMTEAKKDENVDMGENNKDRDIELDYKAKIKPDCDWILGAFDKRAEARAAEANGLTSAKEFLAGQSAALLETKGPKDLSKIGFLSLKN